MTAVTTLTPQQAYSAFWNFWQSSGKQYSIMDFVWQQSPNYVGPVVTGDSLAAEANAYASQMNALPASERGNVLYNVASGVQITDEDEAIAYAGIPPCAGTVTPQQAFTILNDFRKTMVLGFTTSTTTAQVDAAITSNIAQYTPMVVPGYQGPMPAFSQLFTLGNDWISLTMGASNVWTDQEWSAPTAPAWSTAPAAPSEPLPGPAPTIPTTPGGSGSLQPPSAAWAGIWSSLTPAEQAAVIAGQAAPGVQASGPGHDALLALQASYANATYAAEAQAQWAAILAQQAAMAQFQASGGGKSPQIIPAPAAAKAAPSPTPAPAGTAAGSGGLVVVPGISTPGAATPGASGTPVPNPANPYPVDTGTGLPATDPSLGQAGV